MSRNRLGMPTPLCQAPSCGRAQTGVAVENGLGVAHCGRHGEWAKARLAEIIKERTSSEGAKSGAQHG